MESDDFGETETSLEYDAAASNEVTFLSTQMTVTSSYQALLIDFTDGTANDLIYCTIIEDEDNNGGGTTLKTLTKT